MFIFRDTEFVTALCPSHDLTVNITLQWFATLQILLLVFVSLFFSSAYSVRPLFFFIFFFFFLISFCISSLCLIVFFLLHFFSFHLLEFPSFSYKLQFVFHNMIYLSRFGSRITKDASYKREVQSRIVITKSAFNKKKTFHQQFRLKFNKDTGNMLRLELTCVWCWNFYTSETRWDTPGSF